jgi:hypothetical protein
MIECVPEGQTVNQKYYVEVLNELGERVRKKGLELWKKKSQILQQDNAPVHNAHKCIPELEIPFIHRI